MTDNLMMLEINYTVYDEESYTDITMGKILIFKIQKTILNEVSSDINNDFRNGGSSNNFKNLDNNVKRRENEKK